MYLVGPVKGSLQQVCWSWQLKMGCSPTSYSLLESRRLKMNEKEKLTKRIEELEAKVADLVSKGKGGGSPWMIASMELDDLYVQLDLQVRKDEISGRKI